MNKMAKRTKRKKKKKLKRIYNKTKKSARSLAIDRGRTAKKVFPNTPNGRKEYRDFPGYADLAGFDTITKDSQLNRWARSKKSTFQFEKGGGEIQDHIDIRALTDSALTPRENKENMRRMYLDNIRF